MALSCYETGNTLYYDAAWQYAISKPGLSSNKEKSLNGKLGKGNKGSLLIHSISCHVWNIELRVTAIIMIVIYNISCVKIMKAMNIDGHL